MAVSHKQVTPSAPSVALITGISGQDGIYLTELLLNKGYEVHGILRRSAYRPVTRLEHLASYEGSRLFLHYGDVTDALAITQLLVAIQPHEIYHLAAQSDVALSFNSPIATLTTNSIGTLHLLETIRILGMTSWTHFYQASSSEIFGKVAESPQTERTPFYPRSPYAISKLAAFWMAVNYREAHGIFACNGILFNHESPLRGDSFVTQKIIQHLVRYCMGEAIVLRLGNLAARRDWGYAPEYVDAMWRMLQQGTPDDYIIATGRTESVRTFVEYACCYAGIPLEWRGSGADEVGIDTRTGKTFIMVDACYMRPAEVDLLCGDATKAATILGWRPRCSLEQLIQIMFDAEYMKRTQRGWTADLSVPVTPRSTHGACQ